MFFKNFISRNAGLLLHFFCTAIFCSLSSYLFYVNSDYVLFLNVILVLLIVFFFYRIIFKKAYADSLLKILCALIIGVFANHLYSYQQLIAIFPSISVVDSAMLALYGLIGIVGSILIFIFVRLVSLVQEPAAIMTVSTEEKAEYVVYNENIAENGSGDNNETETRNTAANQRYSETTSNMPSRISPKERAASFLRGVGMLAVILIVMAITIYIFNMVSVNGLDKSNIDIYETIKFFASYGASLLLIFFAVIVIIITLVALSRFIFARIALFGKKAILYDGKPAETPTYAISIVIVLVLFFLTYNITGFSMENFRNSIVSGEYLALPLMLLVVMAAFFIFVLLTHGIILWLSEATADGLRKYIKENKISLNPIPRIIDVIQTIIDIVFKTIKSALDFVTYVPNFFEALHKMVLEDEEEDENEANAAAHQPFQP